MEWKLKGTFKSNIRIAMFEIEGIFLRQYKYGLLVVITIDIHTEN